MLCVRFEGPLLLLLIPVGLFILYLIHLHRRTIRLHAILHFILRGLVVSLLIFILAGVKFKLPSPNLCRIYLLDNSGSIFLSTVEALDTIRNSVKRLNPDDRAALIVFGQEASIEVSPVKPTDFPTFDTISSRINPAGTNIEQALHTALSLFPEGFQKEIIMLSDGNETSGEAVSLIPLLRNVGVIVHTLPIGPVELRDIRITNFHLPPYLAENEPISGRVVLETSFDTQADLYLYQEGKLIREFKGVSLLKNQPTRLAFELPPLAGVVQQYETHLVSTDFKEICTANNVARRIVCRSGKPAVLYLVEMDNMTVEKILRQNQDFQMDTYKKSDLLSLYQVIILDNLPAKSLSEEDLARLKDFVESGGGLLILGGKRTFAMGGYTKTVLEEISPVWASPQHNLALTIILDRSGSMDEPVTADKNKFAIARQALTEALKLLEPSDKLEIITFNEQFQVVYPMKKVSAPEDIEALLSQMRPSGGTIILPSLQRQAMQDLINAKAARKHIILISDGTSTANETYQQAGELGRKLKEVGITVSTIATGAQVNEAFLKALNQNGTNGRFYQVVDFLKLAEFLKEDLAYHKELYIEKEGLKPEIEKATEILKDIEGLPKLRGYNCTSLKDRGRLIAAFSDKTPLVSAWQYGRGRVIAFTSSLNTDWSDEWLAWNQLAQFWTQIIRWLTPARPDDKELEVTTKMIGNTLHISVLDSQRRSNLSLKVSLKKQTGETVVKTLKMTRPYEYSGVLSGLAEGGYILTLHKDNNQESVLSDLPAASLWQAGMIPVVVPYANEWYRFNKNISFLYKLSDLTGGKLLKNLQKDVDSITHSSLVVSYQSKTWLIIIIVLGLLLVDLLLSTPLLRSRSRL